MAKRSPRWRFPASSLRDVWHSRHSSHRSPGNGKPPETSIHTSTTVSSVHSLRAAFVRISSRMRCLHIPCFLNQYAAFTARKL
jgi:hypothetical protein